MIVARIGKRTQPYESVDATTALLNFIKTKEEIDALNAKMKEYKEVLANSAKEILADEEASTVTLQLQDRAVKVAFGWDAKIENETLLKKILGERFEDLVSETTTQKPEKKLVDMATEDDALRECFLIKEKAPAVTVAKAV